MKSILLLSFGLLVGALIAQDKPLPVLQYVDGHGNSYEFTADGSGYVLDFAPVKKDMKSRKYENKIVF